MKGGHGRREESAQRMRDSSLEDELQNDSEMLQAAFLL
jgi:hypothetical protein